ncbi:MAG: protoheme IX farnesyltransferase [Rhizobacter sp.]|nr:protoheme IX farnesyltransferase [Bacteriovorax sp.]
MRLKNLSLTNVCFTFALIMWGAVVHNTQSSLACPDWPLCYDQVFPSMHGAILIEHGHRMLATFVGLLTTLMVFFSFGDRKKSVAHMHLFKASAFALFLVIAQGVLGGITVIYKLPTIVSTSHLGLSLIFFSMVTYIHHKAASLVKPVREISEVVKQKIQNNWKPIIRHGILFSMALLYTQILLGAFMRHAGAGAACGLGPMSAMLCMDAADWTVKLWPSMHPSQLHMVHRIYGIVVFAVVSVFSIRTYHFFKGDQKLRFISLLPFFCVSAQVFIGIMTIWLNLSVVPTTLHLAGAALSLISLWKLNLILKDLESTYVSADSHSFLSDVIDLTKPRLSLLVMVTAMVGTMIAPDKINFFKAFFAFALITLVVIGAAALNCYIEREVDAKMNRTKDRPLPSQRMNPKTALVFGTILVLFAIPALCIFVNLVTGILALIAAVLYLYAYTPMKQKSELAVYVGAIPGALPPVMGWTAVTGQIDIMAVTLFLILFVWQLPHFLAISLYHADDYDAASIKVYPNLKRGFLITKIGIFVFTGVLFVTSLLPTIFSNASFVYTRAAFTLSGLFLIYSAYGFFLKSDKAREREWARNYFYGSLFYLPLLLVALIFFK